MREEEVCLFTKHIWFALFYVQKYPSLGVIASPDIEYENLQTAPAEILEPNPGKKKSIQFLFV